MKGQRRRRRGIAASLAACAMLGCGPGVTASPLEEPSPAAARGADVLLVTLDTTRADHLGYAGYAHAETPNLDRLARDSIRFDGAVATAPSTLPSHASILTGLYPTRHGVLTNGDFRLPAAADTLAERLHAAGFGTAAFVSSFVLDARFGLAQGFEHYDDRVLPAAGPAFAAVPPERSARETTDAALTWLAAAPAQPLFLWVHYFDPHAPYVPPAPFADRFIDRPYDGEIAAVDAELGRLVAGFDRRLRHRDNLIVVVGDHGESLGEHGELYHSVFVYDATLRVPMLLRLPASIRRAGSVGAAVSTADLAPTILALLGVEDPSPRDGVALLGASLEPDRAVHAESWTPYFDFGWSPLLASRRRHAKYIDAPQPELYQLAVDPAELDNRFSAERALARAMALELREHRRGEVTPSEASHLDAEATAALESLGYVAGARASSRGRNRSSPLADPKDHIALASSLVEANVHIGAGRLDDAESVLRRQAADGGGERSLRLAFAKLFLRQGRLTDAERELRACLAMRPHPDQELLLAQILILDGRLDEAVKLLAAAHRRDPQHGGVLIASGDLERRRGDPLAARRSYLEAARVDPYRAGGLAEARLRQLQAASGDTVPSP